MKTASVAIGGAVVGSIMRRAYSERLIEVQLACPLAVSQCDRCADAKDGLDIRYGFRHGMLGSASPLLGVQADARRPSVEDCLSFGWLWVMNSVFP